MQFGKTEREIRKQIMDTLQLAVTIARDDGLSRADAEAVLVRVYKISPGKPVPDEHKD